MTTLAKQLSLRTKGVHAARWGPRGYASLVLLGSLLGLLVAAPPSVGAITYPTASSAIVFGSLPYTVAPGESIAWASLALCTGTSSSARSCSAAGSPTGYVPDGYSVDLVVQAGSTCDFSTASAVVSTSTTLGVAAGLFHAPTTPGTYCYELQHPTQVGLGTGKQKLVAWLPTASDKEVVIVYGTPVSAG